jgi:hydrogenase small subunit
VVWVETGICTGCAISLLNATKAADPEAGTAAQEILPDLLQAVRIEFQETLMDGYGVTGMSQVARAIAQFSGQYIMVVDGAIPSGEKARMTVLGIDADGKAWTAEQFVLMAAKNAKAVVALGTCASWGGIPAAEPNLGNHKSLAEVLNKPVIRIPGCPPNPDWILGSLEALLAGTPIDLDDAGRPMTYFAKTLHDQCPRKQFFDDQKFATQPGDPTLCLRKVGCKGTICFADCVVRPYLGRSHCIMANHPCIGCAAPGFPDAHPIGKETYAMGPFYTTLPDGV